VGRSGELQIIDAIIGSALIYEPTIAEVIPTIVRSNPDLQTVIGLGVGHTDVVLVDHQVLDKISLTVVPRTDETTWKPKWTPKIVDQPSVNPFMSTIFGPPPVLGVSLTSGKFEVDADVDPDLFVVRSDFEIGIIQALVSTELTAVYVDEGGSPTWRLTFGCRTLPIRDSETKDPSPPWARKGSVKSVDGPAGTKIHDEDRPRNDLIPWRTKDKKGTLVSTAGIDSFSTWLTVRQKSTGTFTFLRWAMWTVDWGFRFDFKGEKHTPTSAHTVILGQGDGQGPVTPITGGNIANDEPTIDWKGPPGGF
jgi:hypothetical protein